jgi:hypothetical protein
MMWIEPPPSPPVRNTIRWPFREKSDRNKASGALMTLSASRVGKHQQRPHRVVANVFGRVAHPLGQIVDHRLLVDRITQDKCRQGSLGSV